MSSRERKAALYRELIRVGKECKTFGYDPNRFLPDVANSDPVELVHRYVLRERPSDGFERLVRERRLDLSVESVAWRFRDLFPEVAAAARQRLREVGFDVEAQRYRITA